jgi:NDP-sugar pyrophosphorylase family protein
MGEVPALILAGGLGTRLRSVLPDLPKNLAPVGGRPFLTYLLDQLEAAGVRRVVLCTGYRAGQIRQALGVRYGQLALSYSEETEPLGTGGALRQALSQVDAGLVLALNGDSYVHGDLREYHSWHRRHRFAGSLLLTRVPDAGRFGTVTVDELGAVQSFEEKRGLAVPGLINAGVYLLSRTLLEALPAGRAVSLEKEAFPRWLKDGLGGFCTRSPFLDIGTPESFARAETFLAGVGAAS